MTSPLATSSNRFGHLRLWLVVSAIVVAVAGVACTATPPPKNQWVLVVGDSMAHGDTRFGVPGFGKPFDERTSLPISWVGAGGENPLTGPHRWRDKVRAEVSRRGGPPTVLVIEACCSMWTTSTSAAWVSELKSIATVSGASRVVAVTTPRPQPNSWYWPIDHSVTGAQLDLLKVARERRWEVVDLYAIWPVGTPGIHASDGLHFSTSGATHAGWAIAGMVKK